MTALGLTPRMKQALDFIKDEIERKGFAPTFVEIGEHLGVTSKSSVSRLIVSLEQRGHIARAFRGARSIALAKPGDDALKIATDYLRQLRDDSGRIAQVSGTDILWVSDIETLHDQIDRVLARIEGVTIKTEEAA